MKAVRVHTHGGPEVLKYEETPVQQPASGQASIEVEAAGVNFIDTYHRTGLYAIDPPFTPGMEAAGTVRAVGNGVSEVRVGERVAYANALGAYAEHALVEAWKLVPIPEGVDMKSAAALMLQGLTAHYLTHSTFSLRPGHTALVHAAAGGVGLLLLQIARQLGATVYATVSTEAKAELARDAGADQVILYTSGSFEDEVKRLTAGGGVDVAYDSVGHATYEGSLNCLRPRGCLVLYGQASGPVPPFDPLKLASKGSLFLTRPTLGHYVATRRELVSRSADLFEWVKLGRLKLRTAHMFPLRDAAEAHRQLEGRKTTGKVLLIP